MVPAAAELPLTLREVRAERIAGAQEYNWVPAFRRGRPWFRLLAWTAVETFLSAADLFTNALRSAMFRGPASDIS
jgi:hypothetical protein